MNINLNHNIEHFMSLTPFLRLIVPATLESQIRFATQYFNPINITTYLSELSELLTPRLGHNDLVEWLNEQRSHRRQRHKSLQEDTKTRAPSEAHTEPGLQRQSMGLHLSRLIYCVLCHDQPLVWQRRSGLHTVRLWANVTPACLLLLELCIHGHFYPKQQTVNAFRYASLLQGFVGYPIVIGRLLHSVCYLCGADHCYE